MLVLLFVSGDFLGFIQGVNVIDKRDNGKRGSGSHKYPPKDFYCFKKFRFDFKLFNGLRFKL